MMKIKYKFKSFFNMIEVVLAMAVIALAMTSVLALLPVGLNASRDAVGLNYSSDAASDIIGRMRSWAESYANDTQYRGLFTTASSDLFFPDYLPNKAVSTGTYLIPGMNTIGKINTVSTLFARELRAGAFSYAPFTTDFQKLNTGLYKVSTTYADYDDLRNIFFIIQGRMDSIGNPAWTKLENGTVKIEVDFTAMVYLWKNQPVTTVKTSGTWTTWPPSGTTAYEYFGGMNVEVSWPVSLNYLERERCYYYSEIRKPN